MERYSNLDKILHSIVLNSDFISELLFDLEYKLFSDREVQNDKHVFITGLARSGTTILMRALHNSNLFSSLTYTDMPFVLAPNLWQSITKFNRKHIKKHERSHGDGILVNEESPEAFEEVFWRLFLGNTYIRGNCLLPHDIPDTVLEKFTSYINVVCRRYDKNRYLSKNNNNILRLKSLSQHLNNSLILVPFRHPLDQAYSLLTQHKNNLNSSKFHTNYMKWLSHFEFGDLHKRYTFSDNTRPEYDPGGINYWLDVWVEVYEYIYSVAMNRIENIKLVSYELLCQNDNHWESICHAAEIPLVPVEFRLTKKVHKQACNEDLLKSAMHVYERLDKLCK